VLRSTILAAARSKRVEQLVTHAPISSGVVRRFVGGPDTPSAVAVTKQLLDAGLTVTLDHLGEDTTERRQADAVAAAYLDLLRALEAAHLTQRIALLTARSEVSVKLSAIGQALPGDGEKIALEHARTICAEARRPAGLPAPHRERLPRPLLRRQPGPVVQGCLPGAGVRRLPAAQRGRPVLRPVHERPAGG
jgi:proline dehydrogenase